MITVQLFFAANGFHGESWTNSLLKQNSMGCKYNKVIFCSHNNQNDNYIANHMQKTEQKEKV